MTIETSETSSPGRRRHRASPVPRRSIAWRSLIVGVVLVVAVIVAVFLAVRSTGDDATSDASSAARTQAGLCAAMNAASNEGVEEARTIFYDRSHDGLHQLAARAAEVDRAAAARLLETKQRVEGLLDGTPGPGELTPALDRLADATARAASAVGETDVGGCD